MDEEKLVTDETTTYEDVEQTYAEETDEGSALLTGLGLAALGAGGLLAWHKREDIKAFTRKRRLEMLKHKAERLAKKQAKAQKAMADLEGKETE